MRGVTSNHLRTSRILLADQLAGQLTQFGRACLQLTSHRPAVIFSAVHYRRSRSAAA